MPSASVWADKGEQMETTARQIMAREDFKRCAEFHGHICPGLSIGYKAARLAMEKLGEIRAEDEELAAIMETDACCADAVQVLTGCTFGKGNFIHKDYGKMALTLFSRKTGRGVRVVLRPDALPRDEKHLDLVQKKINGQADEQELALYEKMHLQRAHHVLETPGDKLFQVKQVTQSLPPKARIEPSERCARCNEPVMRTKLKAVDGEKLCGGCLAAVSSSTSPAGD